METTDQIQIISFYEFKDLTRVGPLDEIKADLKSALIGFDVRGTIIVANEGFNGMSVALLLISVNLLFVLSKF